MTLREARCRYSVGLAELVLYAYSIGFEIAFDEVTDHITAKDPTTDHMKGSVHEIGLGADLLLYLNGVYLADTESYTFMGEYWEQMGQQRGLPFRWGGRFLAADGITLKPDGNHFSFEWLGKK